MSAEAEPLVRLAYVSVAARPLDAAELEALAAVARRANAAASVGGLLLHGGGRYFGLLEGPEEAVLGRMERVAADPRHREVRVLREEPIPARRFAGWSVGALPATSSDDADLLALDRFLAEA